MRKLKLVPFHPFLISIYAVLALYSANMNEIFINAIGRLLIVLALSTAILLVLFYGLTKNWQKSGLFLSFFLLLFFTYGHIHNLKDLVLGGVNIFRHKYLTIMWLLLGVAGAIFIRRIKDTASFTVFANTMSVIMLIFPVFSVGRFLVEENIYGSVKKTQTPSSLQLPAAQPAPDVYFIVMDAYGREDVLQNVFGYDNSEFIRELRDLGFYVVDCSQSNYARTQLSVSSTLNMDYISNLVADPNPNELQHWVSPLLIHSQVRSIFEGLGYKTVAFYNGYPRVHWEDADYFLQPKDRSSVLVQLDSKLTSFEEMFLNTTLFSTVIDSQAGGTQISSNPSRREADLYMLATLPKIPQIAGPKFIYAHLMLPHPPFVFGPNGEEVSVGSSGEGLNDVEEYQSEANRIGYRDQLIYTNHQIISALRETIEKSPTPPIIVLESDHGPTGYQGAINRMGNFMAYYFPGKDVASVAYPSITPVNSFRLVFNEYFGGKYPLLDDVSYYSDTTYNFNYEIVPNTCAQK
jgi:hypothetical protein